MGHGYEVTSQQLCKEIGGVSRQLPICLDTPASILDDITHCCRLHMTSWEQEAACIVQYKLSEAWLVSKVHGLCSCNLEVVQNTLHNLEPEQVASISKEKTYLYYGVWKV